MNPDVLANWQSWAAPLVVVLAFAWIVLSRRKKRVKAKGCKGCGTGRSC